MSSRISKTIFSVAIIILISRLLGFVREMVIADIFGTTADYDIYLIAVMLPALAYGVINFASIYFFVPFLSKQQELGNDTNWNAIYPPLNLILLSSFVLMLIIIFGSPYIMKIWGSQLITEQFSQVVLYSRLSSVMILLGTTEAFMRAFLNVKKIFIFPAGGFIAYNLFCIASIYFLYESFSVGAIIIGVIAGLFFQNLFLLSKIMLYKPFNNYTPKFITEHSQALFKTAGVVVLIELINRSYFLLDRFIAPSFGEGVISALNYSQVIVQLPDSIIGFAIGAVVFPLFSESSETDQLHRFQAFYKKAILSAVFIAIPIATFFFLHAEQIVYLLFHRGQFDAHSVELTATTLRPYVISIVSLFVISTSMRACYSGGWGRTVLLFVVGAFALKFVLNTLLSNTFGYAGISVATATAHLFFAVAMILFLMLKTKMQDKKQFLATFVSLIFAGISSGYLLYMIDKYLISVSFEQSYLNIVLYLIGSGFVLVVIYLLSLYILRQNELIQQFFEFVKKNEKQ